MPGPVAGNYAYFQEAFDVCSVKPQKPAEVLATKAEVSAANAAADAIVTWCAPEAYMNGDPLAADDRFTYDVFYSSDGGSTWPSAPNGASLSSRSYTHNNPSAGTYIYRVRAKSSCMTCTNCAGLCCSDYSTDTSSVTIP